MFQIRHEAASDVEAREALLDRCFGPNRAAKTCERLRERRLPAEGLALGMTRAGELVGTVRLWSVMAGPGRPALLLGPVAVEPSLQGLGLGGKLIREALSRAAWLGHRAVLLVGDAPYYGRFGFSQDAVGRLWLPGPVERDRFQGLELVPGALAGAHGLVQPTGREATRPDLMSLVAAAEEAEQPLRRAA